MRHDGAPLRFATRKFPTAEKLTDYIKTQGLVFYEVARYGFDRPEIAWRNELAASILRCPALPACLADTVADEMGAYQRNLDLYRPRNRAEP